MKYRRLGRTDLQVSVICLGTMTFGEQNSAADAHQQLDYALENGVNFIDTAELYAIPPRVETYGLTEEYIGTWLEARKCRDEIVLASKVTGPGDFNYIRGGPRLNSQQINQAIDASLRRLKTDYLDLYQVHWPQRKTNFFGRLGYEYGPDSAVSIEETLSAMGALVTAGKVRHIGVSNETPWGLSEYLRLASEQALPRVVGIQNPYSLLNRVFEIGLAEFAHREQIGLLAYSPMAMGVLSGKYLDGHRPAGARLTLFSRFQRYTSPTSNEVVGHYVKLARDSGLDPAQMALAYVNSRPFVTSTIIGATGMGQLQADVESINLNLGEDVLAGIEQIHRERPNPVP